MATLLTWSDRGAPRRAAPTDPHDSGPVLRLLEQPESEGRYAQVVLLSIPSGLDGARELAERVRARGPRVRLQVVDVRDPSDHAALFRELGPLLDTLPSGALDVLLSAGTPQAQTLWVILVQAGLLAARMLQVIPPAFVPDPHPRAVREVRLDIEGFPQITALREELVRLRAQAGFAEDGLVGESGPMQSLRRQLRRVGPAEVPVLVLGETGTGKELVARALHAASGRASGPFVAENCAAFAEGVLASELFGHEKGAFTGATRSRRGLFEQADGGTLFLDEVGDMPPRVQVRLLRVLQEGELRRVGAEAPRRVDVRVIAATHRDLDAMVRAGDFREDLWYRLRGATLRLPPLRERGGDLELLVAHFLAELGSPGLRLSAEAWSCLRAWSWPGNVRELRAEVRRWTVFCEGEVRLDDLSPEIRGVRPALAGTHVPGELRPLRERVQELEREVIAEALERLDGNLSAVARALEVDRNTLRRKMHLTGLS
ncbi:MAG: sigma 54-interacting transcriptional regulator [Alphaproteobacteria bacterium]|nr:sigma 54-interacting transcriptional regulator [Alphaproteobacteria bacterium]MCB9796908.1 sigma 54-interacting transcriptional regulator [Alphaproteobacteria bacterium]